MTDEEFDELFQSLTDTQLLKELGERVTRITVRNGETYQVRGLEDLIAVIEQELYEEK